MKHVVAYKGTAVASLGLMLEAYAPLFIPWANRRIDVEGTHLRPPYWPDNFVTWVRELSKDRGKNEVFAILKHVKRNGVRYQYVGHTGIHRIKWPEGHGATGSVIGARESQGQGIGTEAKLLLLYHAFKVLHLRKIISSVKGFNAQSAGHLLKCGYTFIGRYRAHVPHSGGFVDELLFEVFPENWEPVWEKYAATKQLPRLTDAQRALIQKETQSA